MNIQINNIVNRTSKAQTLYIQRSQSKFGVTQAQNQQNQIFSENQKTELTKSQQQFKKRVQQQEKNFYGLSEKQMQGFGLVGPEVSNRYKVTEDKLSAQSYYSGMPVNEYTRIEPRMSMSGGDAGQSPDSPPPDLPSLLLDSRIVYIGMPLVPAVSELLLSEFLWLNYHNRDKPLYIYINSIGSQGPDGQPLAPDQEVLTIIDMMHYVSCPVYTLALGQTLGNATLVLAAGNKGKRNALPHSRIQTTPPKMNRTFGTVQNIMIKAGELEQTNKTFMEMMARYTGKEVEQMEKDLNRMRYFNPKQAVEYGIIDRVLENNQKGERMSQAVDYEQLAKLQQAQAAMQQRGEDVAAAAGF